MEISRQHYVTDSKEYLTFPFSEYLFPSKHSLKILFQSKHFHRYITENMSGCFFGGHSVDVLITLYQPVCLPAFQLDEIRQCKDCYYHSNARMKDWFCQPCVRIEYTTKQQQQQLLLLRYTL